MIKVFATDITEITPEGSERLYASLPGWRREQLCRITNTKQKMLSAGAGFLLAPALGVFGINALSARVFIGEFGKPYLPDYPDVHFSLSHSGDMAMCAVADSPVGCDIQKLPEQSSQLSAAVAKRFFTPEEYEKVIDSAAPGTQFTRLWVMKESYVKYLGTGIYGCPLNSFEIYGEPPRLSAECSLCPKFPQFREYTLRGHLAAVCCEQAPGDIEIIHI